MATGTVAGERKERKRELETAKEELTAAMASYAASAVAAASAVDGPESHPALVERTRNNSAKKTAKARSTTGQGDSGAHGPPCLHGRPSVVRKAARAAPAVPLPSGERATTPDKAVLRASRP